MARLKPAWKPWGDHPVYVILSSIGIIVGIIVGIISISAAPREETSGVVRDGITKKPVDGAKVTFRFGSFSRTVRTDSEGVYRLPLPSDTKGDTGRIVVEKDGYSVYDINIQISPHLEEIHLTPTTKPSGETKGSTEPTHPPPASSQTIRGIKTAADALVRRAEKGYNWSSSGGNDIKAGENLVNDYNELAQRAIRLLSPDDYIELLVEINTERVPSVAADKAKRLAEEISLYVKSFNKREALQQTANSLAKRAKEGYKWSSSGGDDVSAGNSLVWQYNYLVRRAKTLFKNDGNIQSSREVQEKLPPDIAAQSVNTGASVLAEALASL